MSEYLNTLVIGYAIMAVVFGLLIIYHKKLDKTPPDWHSRQWFEKQYKK